MRSAPGCCHCIGEEEKEKMNTLLQVLFFLCPSRMPLEGSVAPCPCSRAVLLLLCTSSVPGRWCEITRARLSGKLMCIMTVFQLEALISFSVSPVLKPQAVGSPFSCTVFDLQEKLHLKNPTIWPIFQLLNVRGAVHTLVL